jgi:hypothetical protein
MRRKPRSRTHGGRASISLAIHWDRATLPKVDDGIWEQAHPRRVCCGSRPRSGFFCGRETWGRGRMCAKVSQPASRRLGRVFLSWHLRSGLRSRRPPSLRSHQTLPVQTAQGRRTWHEQIFEGAGVRRTRSVASSTRAPRANAVGLAMKSVGKPDAGNPHVRFDERGRETGRLHVAQATAPFLDST